MPDEAGDRRPRLELVRFSNLTDVPHELATSMLGRGVPKDMLERYKAASALTLMEVPGGGQLVCFGTVMGSHRVCLDPHTGAVIAIIDGPPGDEGAAWPINSSLEQFIASVGVVLDRYPFDNGKAEDDRDEDTCLDKLDAERDQAVDDLTVALRVIDPSAMEDIDGFWMTFLDDVQMGNFSTVYDV